MKLFLKKIIPAVIVMLTCACTMAQNAIRVEGRVVDSELKKPLEGAYVTLNKSGIGTITNKSGSYSILIPAGITNPELVFSYIGCENKAIKVTEANNAATQLVILKRTPFQFEEVVIRPDTFLQNLLRRAFKNIAYNYPTEPTNSEAFYRENMYGELNNRLIYFNEGLFKLYTGSYDEAPDVQGKLLKSSKHAVNRLDTVIDSHRWSSGIINFKTSDFVLMKLEFIDPSEYKNYTYRIARKTLFNNDSVYEIEFLPKRKNARYTGVMYLETKSLAYVAAFYALNEAFLQESMGLGTSKRLTRTYKTCYLKTENKWVLRDFRYQTSFKDSKDSHTYIKTIEALNTITTFNGKNGYIPYEERYSEKSVFVEQAVENDSTGWKGHTIIVNDSVFNAQYLKSEAIKALDAGNKKEVKKSGPVKNLRYYLNNFGAGIEECYYTFTPNADHVSVTYLPAIDFTKTIPASLHAVIFKSNMYYYFAKNWRFNFNLCSSGSKHDVFYKTRELGISWRKNIRKRHKPVFIVTELCLAKTTIGYKLGTVNDSYGLVIHEKKISADKFNLYMASGQYAVKGGFQLLYGIKPSMKIGISAAYFTALSVKNNLYMDQTKKGFINAVFGSEATLPLNASNLEVNAAYKNTGAGFFQKQYYSVGIGLYLDIK